MVLARGSVHLAQPFTFWAAVYTGTACPISLGAEAAHDLHCPLSEYPMPKLTPGLVPCDGMLWERVAAGWWFCLMGHPASSGHWSNRLTGLYFWGSETRALAIHFFFFVILHGHLEANLIVLGQGFER
ncbi:hypothetical protein LZ32DRAFT_411967 [Colletotrichum eremochloae]|nr:hypothetical protein LZ32DRAFT_411967 [Colletotrichum eremochloae]